MSPGQCYKRITLIPPIFVLVAFIVYAIYERATYKSEWLTAESMEPLEIAILAGHCLLASCVCLPVLANRRPEVSNSALWSYLSWFGLPIVYFVFVADLCLSPLPQHFLSADFLLFLSCTLPYAVVLIVTFVWFRRSRRAPSPPIEG